MTKEERLFKECCERCESNATGFDCEDKLTCPVYELYEIAKGKKKVVNISNSWGDTTPRNSECLGGVAHASVTY